jgi:hypothetical protein
LTRSIAAAKLSTCAFETATGVEGVGHNMPHACKRHQGHMQHTHTERERAWPTHTTHAPPAGTARAQRSPACSTPCAAAHLRAAWAPQSCPARSPAPPRPARPASTRRPASGCVGMVATRGGARQARTAGAIERAARGACCHEGCVAARTRLSQAGGSRCGHRHSRASTRTRARTWSMPDWMSASQRALASGVMTGPTSASGSKPPLT